MDIELLMETKRLCDTSNTLYHKSLNALKRFLIHEVGVEQSIVFPEDIEFTIDTTETGNEYAYVQAIRIKKLYDCYENETDNYEIQFVFESDDATDESTWKNLDYYEWDLGNLIEAVTETMLRSIQRNVNHENW